MATKRRLKKKKNIIICNRKTDMPVNCTDVKIHRGTPVGNPFYMKSEASRNDVCIKYEKWFDLHKHEPKIEKYLEMIYDKFMMYGTVKLYCFCAPLRCHGITLKNYIWKLYKERNNALHKT